MPGNVLGCLGKFARWFPQVVPGAPSKITIGRHRVKAPVPCWRAAGVLCGFTYVAAHFLNSVSVAGPVQASSSLVLLELSGYCMGAVRQHCHRRRRPGQARRRQGRLQITPVRARRKRRCCRTRVPLIAAARSSSAAARRRSDPREAGPGLPRRALLPGHDAECHGHPVTITARPAGSDTGRSATVGSSKSATWRACRRAAIAGRA